MFFKISASGAVQIKVRDINQQSVAQKQVGQKQIVRPEGKRSKEDPERKPGKTDGRIVIFK